MNTVQVKNTLIGEGRPKICVPIVGKTKTDILEEAKKITTLPVDVVEWRVDWFDDVFATEKVLETAKELQEVLNSFKEIQVKLTTYIAKDQSVEESNNKYPDFYKGFLSLQGYELRVVYAFLKSLSLGSIFLNKSKLFVRKHNRFLRLKAHFYPAIQ